MYNFPQIGNIIIHPRSSLIKLFLFFILFLSFNLQAIEQDLRFKHIFQEQGLSQNKVNCILQDSKGFMWFGTNWGLNKFDGYDFTIFTRGKNNSKVLTDDNIQCIFEDTQQNIWIGTLNGGIYIYDRVSEKLERLDLDSIQAKILDRNRIKSIMQDRSGNIWFVAGNAIIMKDPSTDSLKTYIPDSQITFLNFVFPDSSNNIWFGTEGYGLGLFNLENKTFSYFTYETKNKNSISDNTLISAFEDTNRNLWFGTYSGGLNFFDVEKKTFSNFIPKINSRESQTIKSIINDGKGNLWLGTRNGLYIFNKTTHKFIHYSSDPLNPYSLSNNNIQIIYRDNKKNFWLGTKNGINFLNLRNMQFTHYRTNTYDDRYINGSNVFSILEDRNSNIWFATEDGGLNMLNRETGIFHQHIHNPTDNNSISDNHITSIAEDEYGFIWIGTYQGGLNLYKPKSKRFTRFKLNSGQSTGISTTLLDDNGLLWISTGSGVISVDTKNQKVKRDILPGEISNTIFNCIEKGADDYIWMAGQNNIFYKMNISTFEYVSYNIPQKNESINITALLPDGNNLWLGTKGNGLLYFNEKQNEFLFYTVKDGLANNNIIAILKDNSDNIWVSTANGLSKFNPTNKISTNYFKENGLQNNEFSKGYLKTHSGEFFLGNIEGVISFYPEEISEDLSAIPIILTDFKIFNKIVPIGGKDPILKSHISEAKEISLSYSHTSFTITFAAVGFDIINNIEYTYLMEGLESNWNFVGKRRYATYMNLDPGNYIFKVKTANVDDEEVHITSINISISPPYWQTWWFRLCIIFIIGFILWHTFDYLKQKRDLLKANALANQTQLKLLRNQMNPHFLLNAFSVIRALILVDKDKAWEMLTKFTDYFRYMLLNYSHEKSTIKEEVDAAKNYINIHKVCFHKTLEVSFEVDEAIQGFIVPTFILQPLIENAIKYGIKTDKKLFMIKVHILHAENLLTIEISNMGRIKESNEHNINSDDKHGTSIINIKKRLKIMFKDNAAFQLFEDKGWIHAVIKIAYNENETLEQPVDSSDSKEIINIE